MNGLFYVAGAIAILSTVLVVTRLNAVHALLYLIVSLLSVALVFYALGAPFVAALEVIIYAGAIMVLILFAIMMLNLGPQATDRESLWLQPRTWWGPAILAAILLAELLYVFIGGGSSPVAGGPVSPQDVGVSPQAVGVPPQAVGLALFGPYVLGVELASLLLLAGLVGAFHLGRQAQVQRAGQPRHRALPAGRQPGVGAASPGAETSPGEKGGAS
jgi:NADH-quinone oxidoreductase subunit J